MMKASSDSPWET